MRESRIDWRNLFKLAVLGGMNKILRHTNYVTERPTAK